MIDLSHSWLQVLFCWLYTASPSLTAEILMLAIWWCPCVESSRVVGRCLLWLMHSLDRALLAFALLHFALQSQTCLLLQVSLDFLLFAFQSPMMKKTSFLFFFGVSSKRSRKFSQNRSTVAFSTLVVRHRLGLPGCLVVCFGSELRWFCHFLVCTPVRHFGPFCWLWGLLHFF